MFVIENGWLLLADTTGAQPQPHSRKPSQRCPISKDISKKRLKPEFRTFQTKLTHSSGQTKGLCNSQISSKSSSKKSVEIRTFFSEGSTSQDGDISRDEIGGGRGNSWLTASAKTCAWQRSLGSQWHTNVLATNGRSNHRRSARDHRYSENSSSQRQASEHGRNGFPQGEAERSLPRGPCPT